MPLIFSLVFLLLPFPAWATTRYVTASGGQTSGTCAVDTAGVTNGHCTITRALAAYAGGDEVVFKDGTYTSFPGATISNGGSSDSARTIFRAENYQKAIIQPTSGYAFTWQADWITIRGFRIEGNKTANCVGPGTSAIRTGITIENNYCFETFSFAFYFGQSSPGGVDQVIVRFNYVDSTGWVSSGAAEQMYIGSNTSPTLDTATNIEIYGNTFRDGPGQSIDIKDTVLDINVHHNIFENFPGCLSPARSCNDTTSGIIANADAYQTPTGVVIQNNIFRNMTGRTGPLFLNRREATFTNNVAHNVDVTSSLLAMNGPASPQYDFQNNTFCNTSLTNVDYQTGSGGSSSAANLTGTVFGAAQSVCDAEVTRILAEIAALPGNPEASTTGIALRVSNF